MIVDRPNLNSERGLREDRLAVELDGFEFGEDFVLSFLGELGVAEILGHVLTVGDAPLDEVDQRGGEGFVLEVGEVIVDEEVGEAADGVGLGTGGFGDGDLEVGGEGGEGVGGGGDDAVDGGRTGLPSLLI